MFNIAKHFHDRLSWLEHSGNYIWLTSNNMKRVARKCSHEPVSFPSVSTSFYHSVPSSPMVAPSKMVRTKIFATSVNDQRNPVSASWSLGVRWCFSMCFFPCNSPLPYFFRNKTSHVPCILNISAISCSKRNWKSWIYFLSCQGLETLGKHGNPPAVEGQKNVF